ncbi:polysaccharide lyase family 8 super-sandwich domain-containing protein [Sediminibacterium sp.]|uniref:polysaccharide lyase family 8 super-sandwich domain-containing protein n=1 Tax=Sediminibacterium sp. TaxID=1917865 RepID=UPI0027339134|nr:polysaccharide lyase family 8 super-sandwich domain-containing protein [Sediminibacterium sp.]MDP3393051.1 polysaccharide lyase family 8 super-sandwich domain-containing protein [Sediminibacterium sp.]MDP3567259.1 polysaccharide lyase family 8 super-sandwich domain-containing protein [Sediminibacterium sp.]
MSFKKVMQNFAVLLFFYVSTAAWSPLHAQTDFSLIMDRIRTGFTTGTVASHDNSVTTMLSTQATNGSWPDINYADKSQTNWQPGIHWDRISLFARAYSRVGSSYNGSTVLRQAIINGMNYWLSLSPAPTSTNWYMLSISLPENIGNALVAMRYGSEPLSSQMETALIAWMVKGTPITQSPAKDGSNLTDVAQHYVARACLTQNQTLLQQTISLVSNSLVITGNNGGDIGEGLQADNTFTAHGPQLYLYGYGTDLVSGISNIANYVTGTTYAFAAEKISLLSNFVRGSYLKATRGMYHDFNAFNRQISRPNDGRPNQFIVRNAKGVDLSQYASEYDAAISRINGSRPASYLVNPEHLHFWRTDYTVHHRPAYMFGLRSVSTRTAKSENGNGENLKGYYMTEGANYIAVNGDEYYNIYPVWEWNKIPGTTVPEITNYPLRAQWGVNFGTSAFAGGVSDGQFGASAYAMNDYNTTAKKGWFFFDDEVVCLGAGITSTAAEAINTTLNQCLLDGAVNVKTNTGTQTLANGNRQYAGNLQWAHHDNVGYFFPQGGTVRLSNQAQTGTQKSINTSYSSDLITKDVFKLWFQHGVKPSGSNYAYIVTPGKTLSDMETYDASQIEIWANDATVQAVYHRGLDMLQIIFYQSSSLTSNGITVSASNPCTMLLKNISSASVAVAIADPNQASSSLVIGFQNQSLVQLRTLTVAMPTALMAGSSVNAIINNNTTVAAIPDVYEAVGDAYVRDGSFANTNFATGGLVVKNDAVGFARRSFLQFDLSGYNRGFDSASLRVRVVSAGATIASTTWEFFAVPDNSWTETGITWNNQPPAGSNLLARVQGKAAGTFIYVPVTETVRQALLGNKKLSIRITSTTLGSTTDATFSSREGTVAFRPALLIYGTTDNTSPTIVMQSDVEVNTDAGAAIASGVTLGQPLVTDKYGVKLVSNNAPAVYPIGVTNVEWTAVDNFGNVAMAIQKVTVKDVEPPVISAPENIITSTSAGLCSAVINLTPANATDNGGSVLVSHNAPATFPTGITEVLWTATDASGNTTTVLQTVTVNDTEKPVLQQIANQVRCYETNQQYAVPQLSAIDNCGIATIEYVVSGATQRSGTGMDANGNFNVGESIVTWTVKDIHGNISTISFSVLVNAPINVLIPDVYALNPAVDFKNTIYIGYGPSTLSLLAKVSGGTEGYQYLWNTGAQSSTIAVSESGTYSVNVTDAQGCQAQSFIKISKLDVSCGNNGDKVVVCHSGKSICVALSSVAAHLAHGDVIGNCNAVTNMNSAWNQVVNLEQPNELEVFPNPAAEFVYIQLAKDKLGAEATLYSISGQVIKTIRINQNRQRISLTGLSKGTYIMLVKNGTEVFKKTIIKQ